MNRPALRCECSFFSHPQISPVSARTGLTLFFSQLSRTLLNLWAFHIWLKIRQQTKNQNQLPSCLPTFRLLKKQDKRQTHVKQCRPSNALAPTMALLLSSVDKQGILTPACPVNPGQLRSFQSLIARCSQRSISSVSAIAFAFVKPGLYCVASSDKFPIALYGQWGTITRYHGIL